VVFDAEHFQKDPHGAAFSRFCPSSFEASCGGIPSFTDHAKTVTGSYELGQRPQVIFRFTPQAHAHGVTVQDAHVITRKRP
jgi:hypothetical protein